MKEQPPSTPSEALVLVPLGLVLGAIEGGPSTKEAQALAQGLLAWNPNHGAAIEAFLDRWE